MPRTRQHATLINNSSQQSVMESHRSYTDGSPHYSGIDSSPHQTLARHHSSLIDGMLPLSNSDLSRHNITPIRSHTDSVQKAPSSNPRTRMSSSNRRQTNYISGPHSSPHSSPRLAVSNLRESTGRSNLIETINHSGSTYLNQTEVDSKESPNAGSRQNSLGSSRARSNMSIKHFTR